MTLNRADLIRHIYIRTNLADAPPQPRHFHPQNGVFRELGLDESRSKPMPTPCNHYTEKTVKPRIADDRLSAFVLWRMDCCADEVEIIV